MTYGATDSAYASGGYETSYQGSNGYPDAIYGLTGPGSTAHLQYGNYSSYAYEGYYGGIYAESTTQFDGGYTIDIRETTDYGSTSYDHDVSFTAHNPATYYGAYSYGANAGGGYDGYGYSGYGVTGHYTSATFETSYSGDVETISSSSVAETIYAGGTYAYQTSSMSGEYENGMPIPGSASETSASGAGYSGYAYGYGYAS